MPLTSGTEQCQHTTDWLVTH